ncbi:uncharacterized protein TNCV_4374651 [Trichonephila clavipes]|uniref:Uncharacterized protein n=1 Tax=Trichonephila clavipes TaxID=2585209 RepID=A0A8X6R403_TRICX|nr:uncharacterized protein TNCV_4374651 [Trichonephila clavipes]
MTPKLAPPLLTPTPNQREDVLALDRFNVHRCPTRLVFSGTGLELVTSQATIRYLYHSATAAKRKTRWIVRSVPLEIVGNSGHEMIPTRENRVWSDQEDHEERGSKDRAASTCGPHSDSFNDTSRRRRSNCSTNNFQTPCRSKS